LTPSTSIFSLGNYHQVNSHTNAGDGLKSQQPLDYYIKKTPQQPEENQKDKR